jgi:hypothetical protein
VRRERQKMATFTRSPIAIDTVEVLDSRRVMEDFRSRLQSRAPLKRLNEEARRRGYELLDAPEQSVGYRAMVQSTRDIRTTLLVPGEPRVVREVQFEILGTSYARAASRDQGAVVSTTVTTGEGAVTYDFLLDAPDGNFEKAKEWVIEPTASVSAGMIQGAERPPGSPIDMPTGAMGIGGAIIAPGDVIEAESWWSAFKACLHGRCGSTCLSALVSCSGTWAAYFWCLVAKCGGCVVKCAACSTCDCRWWCKWAVGCCDR